MVFDRQVLTLDITCFAESVAERGHVACHRIGRPEVYEPDYRHRRLLQLRRERYAAAELAAFHLMELHLFLNSQGLSSSCDPPNVAAERKRPRKLCSKGLTRPLRPAATPAPLRAPATAIAHRERDQEPEVRVTAADLVS